MLRTQTPWNARQKIGGGGSPSHVKAPTAWCSSAYCGPCASIRTLARRTKRTAAARPRARAVARGEEERAPTGPDHFTSIASATSAQGLWRKSGDPKGAVARRQGGSHV